MRYLCVHCDHRFEHEGDDKPRCPKCMRVHGLEKLGQAPEQGSRRKRWWGPAIAAGVLVLLGGGYALWATQSGDESQGPVPLEPLEVSDLGDYLEARDADAGKLRKLLAPSEGTEKLAESAAGDESGVTAKAGAVVDALRARAEKEAFVQWPLDGPLERAPKTAAAAHEAMGEDGAEHKLYPLEVAAVAVSALRSAGVDAMLAEAWKFPDQRAPPDPSGKLGYYMVAVYPEGVGNGDPELLDPFAGRESSPAKQGYRVLDDVQAVAAALNHKALWKLQVAGDTEAAFELSDTAVGLDKRSPPIRTVHGRVLAESGGVNEGLEEIRSAMELRADAPRHVLLARVHLELRNVSKASRHVSKALEKAPDYALGHATLAAVHLAKAEPDLAKSELKAAEKLNPNLPRLPILWAGYHASVGSFERAVEKAREGVKQLPHDWRVRLQAAQIFRRAGYYDAMRKQAQKILEIVPEDRQARVRKLIERVLGPTALDKTLAQLADAGAGDGGTADAGTALAGTGELKLGSGSKLLGDEGSGLGGGGEGPSLLGDEDESLAPGKGKGLPSPSGGSKLKLREPGQDLQLDLSE